ncbi:YvrJ family protein [Paenibacillus aurantiacus]|uniref:YvrJ family protein n=1 Tax=Paenibacillus aurantiacus TaxID=1936118 RepID=A0ABV5KL21_9BACL
MDQSQLVPLVTTAIGNFGFPIVVTGYLLLRFEKKIDSLTNTMQEFKIALTGENDKKR